MVLQIWKRAGWRRGIIGNPAIERDEQAARVHPVVQRVLQLLAIAARRPVGRREMRQSGHHVNANVFRQRERAAAGVGDGERIAVLPELGIGIEMHDARAGA